MKRLGGAVVFLLLSCGCGRASPPSEPAWARARAAMVELISRRGIGDPRLLSALAAVPRHLFIPVAYREYPEAYGDYPLSIGYGQTISQPYIVAYMTDRMKVRPGEKVLEIGTGSGYQAAVLAELGAEVFSVEIVPELAAHARSALSAAGYGSVRVLTGDGYRGWAEHAPYDIVIVTCAPGEIPTELVEQLKDGGRMILPVGDAYQRLVVVRKKGREIEVAADLPVRFVPMVPGATPPAQLVLPAPARFGKVALEQAVCRRRSIRRFAPRRLSAAEVGQLLYAAQGVTDPSRGLRAAPSAGAIHPLRIYVLTAAGSFLYLPENHALRPRGALDLRPALAQAAYGQEWVAQAPLVLVLAGDVSLTARRYGERARDYVLLEVGHAAQNVHLQAVALGLGSVPVGAFDPERVARLLDLPEQEEPFYLIPVGAALAAPNFSGSDV